MGIFANPLTDLLEYEDFSRDFLKGTDPVGMTGCIDSEKVHFMSTFLGEKKVAACCERTMNSGQGKLKKIIN